MSRGGALALTALTALTACTGPRADGDSRTLTVLAASSLTEAFTDIAADFEAAAPGTDVVLSFAGSQSLAAQVRHGIDADVFASADPWHARSLAAAGLLTAPRPFAGNRLVLAVPEGGPASLADLPAAERIVLGADTSPIGRYTDMLLDAATARYGGAWRAGVDARVVSREPNVRLVATKVAMGEADAAIVYATDAREGLRRVDLPEHLAPPTACLHGRLTASPRATLADAWLAHVASPAGQARLAEHGFQPVAAAP